MVERIEQKSSDDCSICAVAMITGETYEDVLKAARKLGYIFGSGKGISVGSILYTLGYELDWCDGFDSAHSSSIVSVDSLYFENGKHAVVFHDGEIIDPSRGWRHVDLAHAGDTASFTYFDIHKKYLDA